MAEQRGNDRRTGQSDQEGDTPIHIPTRPLQQPAEDAADARDAAVGQHQHGRREPDDQAASEGRTRREMREVNRHEGRSGTEVN